MYTTATYWSLEGGGQAGEWRRVGVKWGVDDVLACGGQGIQGQKHHLNSMEPLTLIHDSGTFRLSVEQIGEEEEGINARWGLGRYPSSNFQALIKL